MYLRSGSNTGQHKEERNEKVIECSSVKRTRAAKQDIFIGTGHDQDLSVSAKLPLNVVVLRRYLFLRHENTGPTMSTKEIFKIILTELKVLWGRAGIPIKPDHKCIEQFVKLFISWNSLKKKGSQICLKRKQDFENKMNRLCDISSANAHAQLKNSRRPNWEEDWLFLLNQRKFPQVNR